MPFIVNNVTMKRCLLIFGAFHLIVGPMMGGYAKKKMLLENPVMKQTYLPKNSREGRYTCSTFGTDACKLVCQVMCDLYGCESHGYCDDNECVCRERYQVSSTYHTPEEYHALPTLLIWYHKFGHTNLSKQVYSAMRHNDDIWNTMEPIVRNPAQTAIDVKSHLLQLRPDWRPVYSLEPIRRGYIDDFILQNTNKFDYDHFDQYIDTVVDYITDKFYYNFRNPTFHNAATMYKPEIRYLYKLMALCQNEWLVKYTRDFQRRYGYDDPVVLRHFDPKTDRKMTTDSALSVLMISAVDHTMAFEKRYRKGEVEGSRKHTLYYLLSKRQIDDLNDFDFEDFEDEMQRAKM